MKRIANRLRFDRVITKVQTAVFRRIAYLHVLRPINQVATRISANMLHFIHHATVIRCKAQYNDTNDNKCKRQKHEQCICTGWPKK